MYSRAGLQCCPAEQVSGSLSNPLLDFQGSNLLYNILNGGVSVSQLVVLIRVTNALQNGVSLSLSTQQELRLTPC